MKLDVRTLCAALCLLSCDGASAPVDDSACPNGPTIDQLPAGPDEQVEVQCAANPLVGEPPPPYSIVLGGTSYVVRNGFAWVPDGCDWRRAEGQAEGGLYSQPYGAHFAAAYSVQGCEISRVAEDGSLVPVTKEFDGTFDALGAPPGPVVCDLLNPVDRFTSFTLQSPAAPEIPDYNALRDCLCEGTCAIVDNQLELLPDAAHDGPLGLRATAVPPTQAMRENGHTSKSTIESTLVHIVRGDRVTIQAWVRIQAGGGVPYGILDLESTWLETGPGPRLLLEQGALEVELKYGDRPRFRQGAPVPFPIGAWVDVRVVYDVQPDESGHVQVWQDGLMVIDASGQTLPLPNTILNSLEVGITAYNGEGMSASVDVDSLVLRGTRRPP